MTSDSPGLRETHKANTRDAIVRAAYDLAPTPEALTADRIAEAAGISRRTLFNYFPSVEAILASPTEDMLEILRRELSARPVDEDIIVGACAVIDSIFDLDYLRTVVSVWRYLDSAPAAARFAHQWQHQAVIDLTQDWAQQRQITDDPYLPYLMTAVFLAAFDAARRYWMSLTPGQITAADRDAFVRHISTTFEMLRPTLPRN